MTTNTWIALFTSIQTIAIVLSLGFVGFQMRDARRIANGGAYQAWLNSILQFFMSLGQTEGLAQLYWRGRKDASSLTSSELSQFFYLCVSYFTLIENLYIQFHEGLIPPSAFESWQVGLVEDMSSSGFGEYWKLESSHYNPVFRSFVDSLQLESKARAEPSKLSAFWGLINEGRPDRAADDAESRTTIP